MFENRDALAETSEKRTNVCIVGLGSTGTDVLVVITNALAKMLRISSTVGRGQITKQSDVPFLLEPLTELSEDVLRVRSIFPGLNSFESFLDRSLEIAFPRSSA